METTGAEGQKIKKFSKTCGEVFDDLLGRFGFVRSPEHSRAERDFASEVYRNADRYVKVSANTHHRDAPSYCQVTLGEGALTFPEWDWNSVALWQLAVAHGASPPAADPYPLRDVSLLPEILAEMAADLERSGADFLAGDLDVFHRARAELARSREPYKIYTPDADGRYHSSDDAESARLKEQFSREDG